MGQQRMSTGTRRSNILIWLSNAESIGGGPAVSLLRQAAGALKGSIYIGNSVSYIRGLQERSATNNII